MIKNLTTKRREIVVYLVVGILTTIVSWGVCFMFEHFLLNPDIVWQNNVLNTIGWVAGVLFAYPMNRKYVFGSKNLHIWKEFWGFAISRLSTWILDIFIMIVTVNIWSMNYWIGKIFVSTVVVTVLNYVFSKVFVFRKKK